MANPDLRPGGRLYPSRRGVIQMAAGVAVVAFGGAAGKPAEATAAAAGEPTRLIAHNGWILRPADLARLGIGAELS